MKSLFLLICTLLSLGGVANGQPQNDWFADAIWYQIFPERFRNGDPSNDPVPASMDGTWPYFIPADWNVSPWTSDWYELQPWERDGKGFYVHAQLRRYGGDLQGIIDQLDYLKSLGVNSLYLNPVFESASLHKYGATMYHHIDRHFGPDPEGDLKSFAAETPSDPSTWKWSAADKLFLQLIAEVHKRDMRIIIDGVFNHVGIPFWAFQQAKREGPESEFADWFIVKQWDDPATAKDEFDYEGWAGIKDLPELARNKETLHPEIREHFRAIVNRWMDPNGDGDPSDGIDGWRLDVAEEVPMGFWKELRGWVEGINPNAFITGEIWWEDYRNNGYKNARPWLDEAFDSVMNYRFGDVTYRFFNEPDGVPATLFVELMNQIHQDYTYEKSLNQQNLFGSHDTSRIGSAVVNPKYRQDHGAGLQGNREYDVRQPTSKEKLRWKQMVAFQFMSPGAPFVYYGDEVGMWGADDPDCRKPMLWPDLIYDEEVAHPFGLKREVNPVTLDEDMLEFYRGMIRLRNNYNALRRGAIHWAMVDDKRKLVAFTRQTAGSNEKILAVFNGSESDAHVVRTEWLEYQDSQWVDLVSKQPADLENLEVSARGFRLLISR